MRNIKYNEDIDIRYCKKRIWCAKKGLTGIKREGMTMITDEIERTDEFNLLSKDKIKQDNTSSRSLISVIYFDNLPGMVNPEELDELIEKRMIISFRRSNEWVRVSGDPIRDNGLGKFKGPNRRKG
jgi:hypothetical protein